MKKCWKRAGMLEYKIAFHQRNKGYYVKFLKVSHDQICSGFYEGEFTKC